METSNVSGATPTRSSGGIVRAQSVLVIAAVVAMVGFLMANAPSAQVSRQAVAGSQRSGAASVEQVITMPAEEHQPELLYERAANGEYEAALEVQQSLRAKEQLQLEDQMRMAEAARAGGYATAATEDY